jgi:hypothetical protein
LHATTAIEESTGSESLIGERRGGAG